MDQDDDEGHHHCEYRKLLSLTAADYLDGRDVEVW